MAAPAHAANGGVWKCSLHQCSYPPLLLSLRVPGGTVAARGWAVDGRQQRQQRRGREGVDRRSFQLIASLKNARYQM